MSDKHIEFLSASQLAERHGWSTTMVRDLLGEPDKRGGNPRNPKKPTRLYALARIEAVERTLEFRERSAAYLKRSKKTRAKHRTGLAELHTQLIKWTMPEDIPDITFADLAEWARSDLDDWAAPQEHLGAQRYRDLDDMPDPGYLVGFMWQSAAQRIWQSIEPRLDVTGLSKKKVNEAASEWVSLLMKDAWPQLAEMANDTESLSRDWFEGTDFPNRPAVSEWVHGQKLAPANHRRSADLTALIPNLN